MGKINKIFFRKNLSLIFLTLTALFLYPKFAYAQVWDWLAGIFTYIPHLAIKLILQVLILLTAGLSAIASWTLGWVTSDSFISLSYTARQGNPIIDAGLDITQSFVNMGIVLALIFIAFAMILRIKGYETTKVFATLIIIALLVNFAPVFCGIIVDAGNITMSYFTNNISGMSNLSNALSHATDAMMPSWSDVNITEQILALTKSFILLTINSVTFFVLLMFCLIFAVRYVAIWMLVIFSPLAFVAYILPLTRSYFFQWLKQLIQWSFIGAITGFFLYLSEKSFEVLEFIGGNGQTNGQTNGTPASTMPGGEGLPVTFIEEIFMYFIPLSFLIIGLIMSFRTSAAGANIVVSPMQKGGKAFTQSIPRKTGDIAKGIGRKFSKDTKDKMEKQSQTGIPGSGWGRGERGVKGVAKRAVGSTVKMATSPYWAIRRGLGAAGTKIIEADEAEIDKTTEGLKDSRPQKKLAVYRGGNKEKKIGAVQKAVEEGQIDDMKKLGMKDEELVETLREALLNSPERFKKSIIGSPKLVKKVKEKSIESFGEKRSKKLFEQVKINITDEDKEKGIYNSEDKIIANIKPKDIKSLGESALDKTDIIANFWSGKHIAEAAEKFGNKFVTPFQETINGINVKEPEWLKEKNPALDKYLRGTAARNLGLGVSSEEEIKANKDKYEQHYNNRKEAVDRALDPTIRERDDDTTNQ